MDMYILYDYAMKHVGLPYRWGGDDFIEGYDCSGFVIELLQAAGVIPHGQDLTAQGLYNFMSVKGTEMDERPCLGALAFYGKSREQVTHVAFVLERYTMIEAGGGGRTTTDEEKASRQNAFIRLRPINYRSDLLRIWLPKYP